MEQALEAYKTILSQADSYTYTQDSVTPTGRYQYALVQLEPEDPVPTLLLSQETEEYLWFIRVFQYDPESGTVLEPPESLTEGVAEIGGYRGGLGQMADGRGLRTISVSGGTGATVIDRITLEGSTWSLLLPGVGALPIRSPRNFPLWKSSGTMEATPPHWTAGPILTKLPAEKTEQKPVPPRQLLRSPALRRRRFRRTGTGLFLQGRWTATAIRR